MFVYKEQKRPAEVRCTIAFTDVGIRLRTRENSRQPSSMPASRSRSKCNSGRIVQTYVEGIDTSKAAHITATLFSPFTAKTIDLVRSGWLASALGELLERDREELYDHLAAH